MVAWTRMVVVKARISGRRLVEVTEFKCIFVRFRYSDTKQSKWMLALGLEQTPGRAVLGRAFSLSLSIVERSGPPRGNWQAEAGYWGM